MARMFVAVEPTEAVRAHLSDRIALLKDALDGWRWVRPEQWHVTLAFLGNVDDLQRERLEARLPRVGERHQPMVLSAGALGAFDRAARARVLVCGLEGDREELQRLAWSVSAAARKSGIALDGKKFKPHLTLGRRKGNPADLRDLLAAEPAYAGPSFRVDEFVLVESHLGAQVRHEIQARYPLG